MTATTISAGLLTAKEVGELLGCNWRTVYRHADAGLMPAGLKIGGLRRWRESEIQEWINGGCKAVRHVAEERP